jgi:tripartite-type tricarboxylate transporter receptor subunit TctC
MKSTRLRLCSAALLALLCTPVFADNFPSKPVTIIVPYAPGGSNDFIARTVSEELGKRLGQPVLVENTAGAAGTIGAAKTVRSPADGYTLLLASGSEVSIAKLTTPSVKYDGEKDLQPITFVGSQPMVLIGANNLAPSKTSELLAYARANPNALSFGSSGVGTPLHLTGELIKQQAKISMEHVPYKGAGPALTDILGGQIPLAVLVLSSALPNIKTGKVKVFGVTEKKRSAILPDVPSLSETKGLEAIDMGVWFGLFAPAHTPEAVVNRLHSEMTEVLKTPAVRNKLMDSGIAISGRGPKDFAKFIAGETTKYRQIVQSANIRTE